MNSRKCWNDVELRLVILINGQEKRLSTKNAKKHEVEDRLSNPAIWRGVPIGSYRDRMGAPDGENKLAHFRRQVLPIELLSDPSVHVSLFYFVPFVVQASVFSAVSASSAVKTIRGHLCANSNLVQMFELE